MAWNTMRGEIESGENGNNVQYVLVTSHREL